jgi:hypothetical protein
MPWNVGPSMSKPSFANVARTIGDRRLEKVLTELAVNVQTERHNAEFRHSQRHDPIDVRADIKRLQTEAVRFEKAINTVSKQLLDLPRHADEKQHSLRGLDAWIEAMLQEGVLPVPLSEAYPNRCLSEHLLAGAKAHDPHTNWIRVLNKLKQIFPGIEDFNIQLARGWAFPPLAECRAAWEARNGGRWHWHREAKRWGNRASLLDRSIGR